MSAYDPHLIPWSKLVIPQAVNFTLFMGLLCYFLKKPLAGHFAGKNEEFEKNRAKAEEAKAQAEKQNQEIKAQLKALESNSNRDIENARREASTMHEKLLVEAQAQAVKIEEDARSMVQYELVRTKTMLRLELIQKATQLAEKGLENNIKTETREALNEEFINSMKATLR